MTPLLQAAMPRPSWKEVLAQHAPLLLPVAHDALTARLIQLAGYPASQIGGFALVGACFAHLDIDLAQYGEHAQIVRDIIAAGGLLVLVDADDGYGDVKNVTYTVTGYEAMGASAISSRARWHQSAVGIWRTSGSRPRRSWRENCARRWPPGAIPRPSSWPAPMRVRHWGWTKRYAAPGATSRRARTGYTSKLRKVGKSWSRPSAPPKGNHWPPPFWREVAKLPGSIPRNSPSWGSRCCSTRRRRSFASPGRCKRPLKTSRWPAEEAATFHDIEHVLGLPYVALSHLLAASGGLEVPWYG